MHNKNDDYNFNYNINYNIRSVPNNKLYKVWMQVHESLKMEKLVPLLEYECFKYLCMVKWNCMHFINIWNEMNKINERWNFECYQLITVWNKMNDKVEMN